MWTYNLQTFEIQTTYPELFVTNTKDKNLRNFIDDKYLQDRTQNEWRDVK